VRKEGGGEREFSLGKAFFHSEERQLCMVYRVRGGNCLPRARGSVRVNRRVIPHRRTGRGRRKRNVNENAAFASLDTKISGD